MVKCDVYIVCTVTMMMRMMNVRQVTIYGRARMWHTVLSLVAMSGHYQWSTTIGPLALVHYWWFARLGTVGRRN